MRTPSFRFFTREGKKYVFYAPTAIQAVRYARVWGLANGIKLYRKKSDKG